MKKTLKTLTMEGLFEVVIDGWKEFLLGSSVSMSRSNGDGGGGGKNTVGILGLAGVCC